MKKLALVLLALPAIAAADVKVEIVDYHGWKGCYRVANEDAEMIVVPEIGRVLRYAYIGKDNLLWEDPDMAGRKTQPGIWTNYGGDKVWPAPQSNWNWPPDQDIDGSPWTAELIPNGVRITSPTSKKLKLRFVREITMAAHGSAVHFKNRLDNLGSRRQLAPWQITQIDDPQKIWMATDSTGLNPMGYRVLQGKLDPSFHQVAATGITMQRDPKFPFKVGGLGMSGEITATKGAYTFHMRSKVFKALVYPDLGCALEVFTSPDPDKYVELEQLGPLVRMDTGEGSYLQVDWLITENK